MGIENKLRFYCWEHKAGMILMAGKNNMYYRCRYWDYRYRPIGLKACPFCLSLDDVDTMTEFLKGYEEETLNVGMDFTVRTETGTLCGEVMLIAMDLIAVRVRKETYEKKNNDI